MVRKWTFTGRRCRHVAAVDFSIATGADPHLRRVSARAGNWASEPTAIRRHAFRIRPRGVPRHSSRNARERRDSWVARCQPNPYGDVAQTGSSTSDSRYDKLESDPVSDVRRILVIDDND